jgi:hypothetical protein
MRVGAGHKERGHKMGYLLEFTAFRRGQFNLEKFVFYPPHKWPFLGFDFPCSIFFPHH